MKYRKLRIAWSVAWGVVAVLVCGLWVRSYFWWDVWVAGPNYSLTTMEGEVLWNTPRGAAARPGESLPASQTTAFPSESVRLADVIVLPFDPRVAMYQGRAMQTPIWWAAVGAVGIGTLGWWRGRYSLRTMLVAMTVVAVGLVVGMRWWRG
jgi:hypothetical protein